MEKESSCERDSRIQDDLKSSLLLAFLRERLMDGEYGMSSDEAGAVVRWYRQRLERCGESGRLESPAKILQVYLEDRAAYF